MTLSAPTVARQRTHCRTIVIEGYRREDGLWDIEGHLKDVRDVDTELRAGHWPAGSTVHEMVVRMTITSDFDIVDTQALTVAAPYPGVCGTIAPDYQRLNGVRIKAGFRREVLTLFGGLRGCAHISELLITMGTGAIQTVTSELDLHATTRPAQIDGCHALASTGASVARFYPEWHRKPGADGD